MKVGDLVEVLVDNADSAMVRKGDRGKVRRVAWDEVVVDIGDEDTWYFSPENLKVVQVDKACVGLTRSEFLERLEALYNTNVEISRAKNADYAQGSDPFQNFRVSEQFGVPVARGIMVRMSDKMVRIGNLLDKDPDVADEPITDALSDLANYAMILRIWLETNERK